jgi:hypothetical protein
MSNRIPEDSASKKARAEARLAAHRGMATWGERLVPLGTFRAAAREVGRCLSAPERAAEILQHRTPIAETPETEGPFDRIAVFGGVYNNRFALEALLADARKRRAEALFCLGDLGGFGPSPEAVWPLLESGGVRTIQGNYEQSLSSDRDDCGCGYTDPRDNHYADISYQYTAERCSPAFKRWMGELPRHRRVSVGGRNLLLVHGSPRRVNEFLFDSTAPDAFLEVLLDQYRADAILCTHTGIAWHRRLPSGRDVVNVGVIGRPGNDGRTDVWYAVLAACPAGNLAVEIMPLAYDHDALAAEMRREELPGPFVETVLTGWWTTCLEILPARERAASRY